MIIGSIQFLVGSWNEDLSSLLSVSWRPLSDHCPVGLLNMAAFVEENLERGMLESYITQSHTSHHLCSIHLVRNKSHLDWSTGCPDSWLNIISGFVYVVSLNESNS